MTYWILMVSGSVVVLLLLAVRALQAWRHEVNAPKGIAPGRGHTLLESDSLSGGGGSVTYRVPKDPQEYAKAFVPSERKTDV